MMDMLQQGMELSEVDDLVFQQQNSRHTQGYFGLMTRGLITRRAAYVDGVIAALTRFVRADLFAEVCMERGEP
jgi:non-canonical (house-cleaning) NTP pyrophosphatase